MNTPALTRRDFICQAALVAAGGLVSGNGHADPPPHPVTSQPHDPSLTCVDGPLDLKPAKWLWYPGDRTLPNTMILFRRPLKLNAAPKSARGWILADSRYRLEVNGQRIQWGPAPSDPRWPEADPLDLAAAMVAGENVIAAAVLHFGHGEGTWAMGKPGLIFRLELEHADGRTELIVSDGHWRCHLSRAWPAGQHQRWFLRAFQEHFDARLHPHGWSQAGFVEDGDWIAPQILRCPPDKPSLCSRYPDALNGMGVAEADARAMHLRRRTIPLMREGWLPVARLSRQHRIEWRRPIAEYFAMRPPNAWRAEPETVASAAGQGAWRVALDPQRGTALTFELPEQIVGWPGFTIEAPAGTTIELITSEAHAPDGPALINTSHHFWSRLVCRDGVNRFETFDFDSLRWLQLHFHPGQGQVTVSDLGVRRRSYPWPREPRVTTSEAPLQKLFDAAANTLRNCAQETLVDGMGRERQQYSGDCGHQIHALHLLCAAEAQVARYLATYSQGMTIDGYFLDTWPGVDRLARLAQRQLQTTQWGPLLDHGVQFAFDCWHHYLYTGRLDAVREPYPRLLRFAEYLRGLVRDDGLLPVENLGVTSVWMDWITCYPRQRHKQCAFNLYVAAMHARALAPLCRVFGDEKQAEEHAVFARRLLKATVKRFWSDREGAFVDNLPWLAEEGGPRFSDRALAMSVLFDQCPVGTAAPALRLLAERPPSLGLSYPANSGWRQWALAAGGRTDEVLRELRELWAPLDSVRLNNTLPEFFEFKPDGTSQWSHAAVVPLYIAVMGLAGIRPLEPGFARYEIRPQLADLPDLGLTMHTPHGPIGFSGKGPLGARTLTLTLPPNAAGELVVHPDERLALKPLGKGRFRLPAGQTVNLELKHS